MLFTLHNQSKKSLISFVLKLYFFTTSFYLFSLTESLAGPPSGNAKFIGKKVDFSNDSPSNQHYYSKFRLYPTDISNINTPLCTTLLTGMLLVDETGTMHLCRGGQLSNLTEPWDQTGNNVFPIDFIGSRVAIGSRLIPKNHPNTPDLVKLYIAQQGNQMEFKPTDVNGDVGIEMYTGSAAGGPGTNTSTYIDFLVGERGNPWDARIEYQRVPGFTGLKFIAQRKIGMLRPLEEYPELKLYANGNVDFGSDENNPPLPALPRGIRQVKVFGSTKADTVILDTDGPGGNPPAPLKVKYDAPGGGYYAVYSP